MTTQYERAEQEGRDAYRRGWPLPRGKKLRDRARRRGWLLEASRWYPGRWTAKIPDPRRSGALPDDRKPLETQSPDADLQ